MPRGPSIYTFLEAGKGWVVIKDEFIVVPSFLSRQKETAPIHRKGRKGAV